MTDQQALSLAVQIRHSVIDEVGPDAMGAQCLAAMLALIDELGIGIPDLRYLLRVLDR
jgi:hypothetical protein